MSSQDTEEDEQAGSVTRRDRSPNYPSLPFTEALAKARKIWDAEQKHFVSSELAAKHAGYNKLNGASVPALAAMKRYGLLQGGPKKEVRITDDAHFIFVHPDDAPERLAMIRKLAMMPELFTEVLAMYPEGLPSDANLKAKLRYHWKFASDEAADAFIRALRDALKTRGPITSEVSDSVHETDTNAETIAQAPPFNPIEKARIPPAVAPLSSGHGHGQARPWDLGDGAVMTVILPQVALSKKNLDRLKKYVAALEMEASIAWDDTSQ